MRPVDCGENHVDSVASVARMVGMWSDEDVSEMDARLEGPRCPRCDDLLCGDTDVMVNGERWCSCCAYKAGFSGEEAAS